MFISKGILVSVKKGVKPSFYRVCIRKDETKQAAVQKIAYITGTMIKTRFIMQNAGYLKL